MFDIVFRIKSWNLQLYPFSIIFFKTSDEISQAPHIERVRRLAGRSSCTAPAI